MDAGRSANDFQLIVDNLAANIAYSLNRELTGNHLSPKSPQTYSNNITNNPTFSSHLSAVLFAAFGASFFVFEHRHYYACERMD